jgi:prenyltransferase beta subunit
MHGHFATHSYSYWIGGTLYLLEQDHLLDQDALKGYIMECQSSSGGFGKVIGHFPDLLHSFYSLAWLSLSNTLDEDGQNSRLPLNRLNCALGIRQERTAIFPIRAIDEMGEH